MIIRYLLCLALLSLPLRPIVPSAQGNELVSANKISLSHGEKKSYTFSAGKTPVYLWLQAAVRLKEGEGWGAHALGLKVNGKPVDGGFKPLNKPVDATILPVSDLQPKTMPFYAQTAGAWFLRYDSDDSAFNDQSPGIFAMTGQFRATNHNLLRSELGSLYYQYLFDITPLLREGQNTLELAAVLPEEVHDLPVEISHLQILPLPDAVVFSRPWMEAVYPWTVPSPKEFTRELNIAVAPGQHGQTTFSVYATKPLIDLAVQVESEVFPAGAFDLRIVEDTKIAATREYFKDWPPAEAVYHGRKMMVPETLAPALTKTNLAKQTTRRYWLKFKAPSNAAPGEHRCRVTILSEGKPVRSLELTIKIWPFTLPIAEQLPISYGLFTMAQFPTPYDSLQVQRLQDIAERGVDSIIMSNATSPVSITREDGRIKVDLERLARDIAFLQNLGLNKRYIRYTVLQQFYTQIAQVAGAAIGDPAYDAAFIEVLRQIYERAKAEKWPLYIVLHDEPNSSQKPWEELQYHLALMKKVPDARTWLDLTEEASAAYLYKKGLLDKHDIPASHPENAYTREPHESIKGVLVEPVTAQWVREHIVWEYSGVHAAPPVDRNRFKTGYLAWKMNLKTFWGFAWWWGNTYDPQRKVQHRYYLTYPFPGEDGRLYSTLGWEAFREGVDDYRYLYLLRETLAKKHGDAIADREIEEFLKHVPYQLNQATMTLGDGGYDALRHAIAERIVKEQTNQ